MIEERIADRFRTAVLDEPPLGFDPDDLVDRAKRRQRHRTAVGASALATIAVAVAAVAIVATSGGTPLGGVGSPGTSEAPPSDPEPSGTPDSPRPPDKGDKGLEPSQAPQVFPGSEDAVKSLTPAISAVLAEKVPDLKFTKPDSGTLMVDAEHRSVGGAFLATGTKHRYVTIFVSHNKDTLDLEGDLAAGGDWGPRKSDEVQNDGSHIRVYASDDADGTGGMMVVHLRTDGVIVMADTTMKPEPGRQGLAVDKDVLRAIATDGRLTF